MLGTPVSHASVSGRLCLNFSDINLKHTGCLPSPSFQRPESGRVPQLPNTGLSAADRILSYEICTSLWVIHSLVLDVTLHACLELGSWTLTGPAFRGHCKASLRGCALAMLVSSLHWRRIGQIQVCRVQGRALGPEELEALRTVWAVKDQVLWQEPRCS